MNKKATALLSGLFLTFSFAQASAQIAINAKAQDLVNLSGVANGVGQSVTVFTVPTGRCFVLTDIQVASFFVSNPTQPGSPCQAYDPAKVEIREGVSGTVKWSQGLAALGTGRYSPTIGIPFSSGSQIVLDITADALSTNPADFFTTWHLAGYLSGAPAATTLPPRPENIVSLSGSVDGISGGDASLYQVPAGKWLIVRDFSVVRNLDFGAGWSKNNVEFAEFSQSLGGVDTVLRPGKLSSIPTTKPTVQALLAAGSHYAPNSGMAFAPNSFVRLKIGAASQDCAGTPNAVRTDWHFAGYLVDP